MYSYATNNYTYAIHIYICYATLIIELMLHEWLTRSIRCRSRTCRRNRILTSIYVCCSPATVRETVALILNIIMF